MGASPPGPLSEKERGSLTQKLKIINEELKIIGSVN
jgi:hypothetical protein